MAEAENNAVMADGEQPFRPLDMRTAGKLLKHRPAISRALEWAHETLKAARLPTKAGRYTLDSDGTLVSVPAHATAREVARLTILNGEPGEVTTSWPADAPSDVAWVADLSIAVVRCGYGHGSPEASAAKVIDYLAAVSGVIVREQDAPKKEAIEAVAAFAFQAGALWKTQSNSTAAAIGRKVRSGGSKSAAQQTADDAHAVILVENNRLLREGTKSERKFVRPRARAISDKFSMSFHTVHGILRKYGAR
jgi:hypothetical protein